MPLLARLALIRSAPIARAMSLGGIYRVRITIIARA